MMNRVGRGCVAIYFLPAGAVVDVVRFVVLIWATAILDDRRSLYTTEAVTQTRSQPSLQITISR